MYLAGPGKAPIRQSAYAGVAKAEQVAGDLETGREVVGEHRWHGLRDVVFDQHQWRPTARDALDDIVGHVTAVGDDQSGDVAAHQRADIADGVDARSIQVQEQSVPETLRGVFDARHDLGVEAVVRGRDRQRLHEQTEHVGADGCALPVGHVAQLVDDLEHMRAFGGGDAGLAVDGQRDCRNRDPGQGGDFANVGSRLGRAAALRRGPRSGFDRLTMMVRQAHHERLQTAPLTMSGCKRLRSP